MMFPRFPVLRFPLPRFQSPDAWATDAGGRVTESGGKDTACWYLWWAERGCDRSATRPMIGRR